MPFSRAQHCSYGLSLNPAQNVQRLLNNFNNFQFQIKFNACLDSMITKVHPVRPTY